ncbi:hypothetical protein [Streptomyces sp. NBC_01478]|uniref:hypothetical protein n=1 Tax=Streptomyces sp. NBC_01478 TaxID=2903882 RepID=UPI003FCED52E
MTDTEWAAMRPLLPVLGWMARPGKPAGGVLPPGDTRRDPLPGRQRHQVAGDACHLMPWGRVYAFFRRWRDRSLVVDDQRTDVRGGDGHGSIMPQGERAVLASKGSG